MPDAILVTVGLMAAVCYVSEAPVWGWLDARTLGALAMALVLLAAFVVHEQRVRHPLMTLSILAKRNQRLWVMLRVVLGLAGGSDDHGSG